MGWGSTPSGTLRFKKIDGSFWNGETFRFADYTYIDFLQTCQIGLSTQNPDAAFNNTSFPSKILSYMSNGLQVVSADIEAVRRAYGISGYIYYYQKQEPSDIANAILNVDLDNPFDTRAVVQSLDNRFVEQLSLFLRDRV